MKPKKQFEYPGNGVNHEIADDESSVANFKLDNYDCQSQVSHLFNEEEME